MKALLIVLAIIVILVAVPFMTIWSLNTLFALGIAYTLHNWIAAWWLGMLVAGGSYYSSNK